MRIHCVARTFGHKKKLLHFIVCSYHATYGFQNESKLYSWLNVKELHAPSKRHIWRLSDCKGTRTHNHLVCKQPVNHLSELAKCLSCVVSTYLCSAFDCSSNYVRTRFRVKELLARTKHHIWRLSNCNVTRTQNHLVCKRTRSHLAKLFKWSSCVVSAYLYAPFNCILLSCQVCYSEWTHTL